MALKLRKDIKKSSYYVWFLGAKESKGLRGTDYTLPVIQHLEKREKDIEPFKVTLQVSHKGLKIIQNILATNAKSTKPKNETIKHFIPHNTITCVHQVDDVIACILLLFNPVTKCPLHVHAYRCDSLETAGLLRQQLQLLIDRPENQKKFAEIENRLLVSERTKKEALATRKNGNKVDSSLGSDTGTSTATRESDSSDDRYNSADTGRITALYDSLAAELRAKLSKSHEPILLPPRDYDTVHRQKGNLAGIELRRCRNSNIVGNQSSRTATNKKCGGVVVVNSGGKIGRLESSGGSSGIGSDHAPSPESPVDTVGGIMGVGVKGGYMVGSGGGGGGGGGDGHSTSEEEWNEDYPDPSIYLLTQTIVPKAHLPPPTNQQQYCNNSNNKNDAPTAKYIEDQEEQDNYRKKLAHRQLEDHQDGGRYYERQRTPEESADYVENRMDMYQKQQMGKVRRNDASTTKRYSVDEDDGFEDNEIVYRTKSRQDQMRPRSSYLESDMPVQPVPKVRHHLDKDVSYLPSNRQSMPANARYVDDYRQPKYQNGAARHFLHRNEEFFEQNQPLNRYRSFDENNSQTGRTQQEQREMEKATSPRERFYDAKEKFLLLEKERDEMQMKLRQQQQHEAPISPVCKEQPFMKRSENLTRYHYEQQQPKPAPRNNINSQQKHATQLSAQHNFHHQQQQQQQQQPPVVRYRNHNNNQQQTNISAAPNNGRHSNNAITTAAAAATAMLDHRYQQQQQRHLPLDKYDQKRRSMFNLIEDEHRRNSAEIARELKRRSYLEGGGGVEYFGGGGGVVGRGGGFDTGEKEKELAYSTLDKDQFCYGKDQQFSKSSAELDKLGELGAFVKSQQKGGGGKNPVAGCRHSYVEPKYRQQADKNKKQFAEMLHRTNSSVSNSGRVGIASIHPY